jgi:hypothetical protein
VFSIKKDKRLTIRLTEEEKLYLENASKKTNTSISNIVSLAIAQYKETETEIGFTYLDLLFKMFPKIIECFEEFELELITLLEPKQSELSILTMIEKCIPFVFLFQSKFQEEEKQYSEFFDPLEVRIFIKKKYERMNFAGYSLLLFSSFENKKLTESEIEIRKDTLNPTDIDVFKKPLQAVLVQYKIRFTHHLNEMKSFENTTGQKLSDVMKNVVGKEERLLDNNN